MFSGRCGRSRRSAPIGDDDEAVAGNADAAPLLNATTGVNPRPKGKARPGTIAGAGYDFALFDALKDRSPRPSFAMVCPDSVQVTGCFPRDRDRKASLSTAAQAGSRRPRTPSGAPLARWKSSIDQAFTDFSPQPVVGRSWQACMEAGSHLVKNSVFSRQLRGFGVPEPASHVSCVRSLARMLHVFWSRPATGTAIGRGREPAWEPQSRL